MIPTSAVSRGDVVLVTEEYANSLEANKVAEEGNIRKQSIPGQIVDMRNTPEGYKYIKVTTGLSSSDYIEIKEGIDEGAEVYVVTTTTGSTMLTTQNPGMMIGGAPNMGSMRMPMGGGMPDGGNFSQGGNRGQNMSSRNSSR